MFFVTPVAYQTIDQLCSFSVARCDNYWPNHRKILSRCLSISRYLYLLLTLHVLEARANHKLSLYRALMFVDLFEEETSHVTTPHCHSAKPSQFSSCRSFPVLRNNHQLFDVTRIRLKNLPDVPLCWFPGVSAEPRASLKRL